MFGLYILYMLRAQACELVRCAYETWIWNWYQFTKYNNHKSNHVFGDYLAALNNKEEKYVHEIQLVTRNDFIDLWNKFEIIIG